MAYIGNSPALDETVSSSQIVDLTVDTADIAADAITGAKIEDDAIDSEHYVDASIDNAHLADDAVGVAELSATGTASSSTFLRGDNAWAAPTAPAITAIASASANQILTDDGDATVTSEAGLTFDGTHLSITADDAKIKLGAGSDGEIYSSSDDLIISNVTSDKDILFKGNDGGSTITALTLDMSDGGTAQFRGQIEWGEAAVMAATKKLYFDGGDDVWIQESSDDNLGFYVNSAEVCFVFGDGFAVNATKKLFIDGGGDTYIQETSANVMELFSNSIINVKPQTYFQIYQDGGSTHKATWGGEIDISGKFVPISDNSADFGKSSKAWKDIYYEGSLTDTSDERFKENIEDCDLGLDFINALQPRKFNKILDREQIVTTRNSADNDAQYIDTEELVTQEDYDPERKRYGIIAQEVIEVLKSLDKQGKFWGIDESDPDKYHADYISFIAPLMKAVQELSSKVEALENA